MSLVDSTYTHIASAKDNAIACTKSEDNAAYIVRACNAYPRLVAELKRLCVEIPAQLGAQPFKNELLKELGEQP